MASSSDSFSNSIAAALGIDAKDVASKIDGLTIEQMNNLINAVSDGNNNEIKTITDAATSVSSDDVHPLLAPKTDASAPAPAAPAQAPGDGTQQSSPAPVDPNASADGEDDEEQTNESVENEGVYALGDLVLIDGKTEATVQTPRGPLDTVGCIIDGKQRMIKKSRLSRVAESIVGAAEMASFMRMRELAGLPASIEHMPFQIAKVRTNDVPGAPRTQAKPIAVATNIPSIFETEDEHEDVEDFTEGRFSFFKSLK